MSEKHTVAALGAAAGLGFLQHMTDKKNAEDAGKTGPDGKPIVHNYTPTVAGIQPGLLYGAGAWAVGRYTKNPIAMHIATGLLSIGIYESVKEMSVQTPEYRAAQAASGIGYDDEYEI